MNTRAERCCLGGIVLLAIALRVPWESAQLFPSFWFTLIVPGVVSDRLSEGGFFDLWIPLFRETHVDYSYDSAILFPVYAVFLRVFGPSLVLPAYVGSLWGAMEVVAAWFLARMFLTRDAALAVAALASASPLQIVWAQVGDYYISSTVQVLLSAALAFRAGQRGSLLYAVAAALAVWCGLYLYYLSRLSFVIAPVALIVGSWHRSSPAAVVRYASCFILVALAPLVPPVFLSTDVALWPRYTGYSGWRGEQSLYDVIVTHWKHIEVQLYNALDLSFYRHRLFLSGIARQEIELEWKLTSGGLIPIPLALLGVAGILLGFFRLRSGAIPLILAGAGFVVPLLSVTTPRRLLIFELGWIFLAALPLELLIGKMARARWWPMVAACSVLLLHGWSARLLAAVNRASVTRFMSTETRVNDLPFGQGWIGDGVTCYRCRALGFQWRDEMERGSFFLLFDSDLAREEAASPAGLYEYGKLAALEVGRRRYFRDFYRLVENSERGPYFDAIYSWKQSAADFLRDEIISLRPAQVIWHFERPTAWERQLVAEAEEVGGMRVSFQTPLSDTAGIRVIFPDDSIPKMVTLLAKRFPAVRQRVRLEEVYSHPGLFMEDPYLVVPLEGSRFGVATLFRIILPDREIPLMDTFGIARSGSAVSVLSRFGAWNVIDAGGEVSRRELSFVPRRIGLGCWTMIGSAPLLVDPVRGKLRSESDLDWLPTRSWIGALGNAEDELLLASSDQRLSLFDVSRRELLAEFPAVVWPSVRLHFGECAMLARGDEWVATFNALNSRLSFYRPNGEDLGTIDLMDRLALPSPFVTAVAGSGEHLAMTILGERSLRIFRVEVP